MANQVPYDPEILIDNGGDATNINYTGAPITVGQNGGGIFVFHNATGNPLTEIDLNLDFPLSPLPNGFTVSGTIGIPPPGGQHSTFRVGTFSGFDCDGSASMTFSCVELSFIMRPGPLIPIDGNFVLDFNNSADYTADDLLVESGHYTGGDIPGGTGAWGPNGTPTMGHVEPVSTVPEPSYRAASACMGLGLVLAWQCRRLLSAKKS
jgi:hypothetical protein